MCIQHAAPSEGRAQFCSDSLQRIARGDRHAFEALYRQTSGLMYSVVSRVEKDSGRAEEVVQEVYVKVWQRADEFFAHRGSALAWMTTIARHAAIDSRRQSLARPQSAASYADDDEDPLDRVVSPMPDAMEALALKDGARSLCACLETLPGVYRQSLALVYYQGLSHSEAAASMQEPLGTVKSWVRRSMMSLKDCMEKRPVLAVPLAVDATRKRVWPSDVPTAFEDTTEDTLLRPFIPAAVRGGVEGLGAPGG